MGPGEYCIYRLYALYHILRKIENIIINMLPPYHIFDHNMQVLQIALNPLQVDIHFVAGTQSHSIFSQLSNGHFVADR